MTGFNISPDTKFTTMQVSEMTGIEQGRLRRIIEAYKIPHDRTKEDGPYKGHIRIALKDFDKIVEADKQMRKPGVRKHASAQPRYVTWTAYKELVERVEFLEKAFDYYTAPDLEVASPSKSS